MEKNVKHYNLVFYSWFIVTALTDSLFMKILGVVMMLWVGRYYWKNR